MLDRIYTIDFETTGVDSKTCHPVEVAVYGEDLNLEILIKPPCNIPPETSAIHHITDEDVATAEPWEVVRNDLASALTFGKDSHLPILVAHNAVYEQGVLLRNPEGCEDFPPVLWICTYKAALRIWPDAPAHKNEVLRYWLGLGDDRGRNSNQRPHSAMHDAKVTYLLLQEMLNHATIDELVEWTELPAKLPKMPMGKHYGLTWDKVPGDYLQWCIKQADMREDVVFCAREELDRRRKENAAKRLS